MTTAALGGTIEVPTLDGGKARVTIPDGAQTGRQFRLKGKGMPPLRGHAGGKGDMYIQATIETPVNLTARQKELLDEFEKETVLGSTEKASNSEFCELKGGRKLGERRVFRVLEVGGYEGHLCGEETDGFLPDPVGCVEMRLVLGAGSGILSV